jgi:hypothetical protein
MTDTLCEFILTKSLDLPLYSFPIFPIHIFVLLDSLVEDRYCETFGYYEGLDLDDA